MSIKIKVGSLTLVASRDVNLPQEFAAWHQTVRIDPGTYDVYAYIDWEDGGLRLRSLLAECEGITISSNFRAHMLGSWGKSDNNCNDQRATAHVDLPTYGTIAAPSPILAQVTLCDAIMRVEWDPCENNPHATTGKMWRFTWNPARKPIVIQQARHSGGLSLAAFEDTRHFRVDTTEMSPGDLSKLDLLFQHGHSADRLSVGEAASGWSFRDKASRHVTRLI